MKKKGILLVLFLLSSSFVSIYSQSRDILLDFNITIKDLISSTPAQINRLSDSGVNIILEGALASYSVISHEESSSGNVEILIKLINGEWINENSVEMYEVKVQFTGDSWLNLFPENRKEASEKAISNNTQILVLCTVEGFYEDSSIPLLSASDIRVIP